MTELMPDSWRFNEEDQKCCQQSRRPRRGPVTEILLWVECYASLVSVLATKYPDKTPQLMMYQKTIVKAQRTFIGEGWITYDACYRRRASFTKSLDWGVVDFTLYNETFTGRAKTIARCHHCMSEYHTANACMYAPDIPSTSQYTARLPTASKVCNLFNSRLGNMCRYNPCRYTHSCTECQGSHPRSSCHRSKPPPPKRARSDSAYHSKR